jgi:hypothetical protein
LTAAEISELADLTEELVELVDLNEKLRQIGERILAGDKASNLRKAQLSQSTSARGGQSHKFPTRRA